MPYIGCQTNKKLNKDQTFALERRFGESIALFPGITEDVLMVAVSSGCPMAFKGDPEAPVAFLDVRILESALEENPDYGIAAADMMKAVSDVAGVPEENIYITFIPVANWGRKHDGLYML